jgi:periplasmic divalent cation tolerance protein
VQSASSFVVVLVTTPSLKVARLLAISALKARLAACANIVPGVESHYWWRKRLCLGKECLMILKTRQSRLKQLEKLIVQKHPYETPEFIVLPLSRGNAKYLAWMMDELAIKRK